MDADNRSFERAERSAFDARAEAQRLAFAPVVFQCVLALRREGVLERLVAAREVGVSIGELKEATGLNEYALTVLLETALSAEVVKAVDGRWVATQVGWFLERDPLSRVNMDFVADVCYRALEHIPAALREGRPAGLRELGPWTTVYEGLSSLPEPARASWFAFDHFYSDSAFPAALEILSGESIDHLVDVGANTGRFARAFLGRNPRARMTLVDLPQQLELARASLATVADAELPARAAYHPCDVLARDAALPSGADAFWMSQFLCCFSENEVESILSRARVGLNAGGSVYVLDTFWDRQKHDVAAYCLMNTSPYFTVVANGNSRMYKATDMIAMAARAGLALDKAWDDLGWSHTLLRFSPASDR
jgi:hypothetical protein